MSEAELRQKCDCTILGTNAFQAVDAIRQLGFPNATSFQLTRSKELMQWS
jgi:hypothetical protein